MRAQRQELFNGRHFEAEIIVLCVRWYLRFGLSFRNLEEMMAERNLSVDHVHQHSEGKTIRKRVCRNTDFVVSER
jgi:transposase-like protein